MPEWGSGRADRPEKVRASEGLEARAAGLTGQNERAMGATILDGKAAAKAIREELTGRVAKLAGAGRTPGLGTILVGDDPGSQAYVRGKHADCAKVGITSIRRDLPADISQATLDETIDELNANRIAPYICSFRSRSISTRTPPWSASTRQGRRRSASDQSRRGWCSTNRRRCPARPVASCTCCAGSRSRSPVRTSW
jgi:hypothetical protein